MWHVRETGEMHKGFCWQYLRRRDHLEDVGIDWRIILKCMFQKWDEGHGGD
jgi:hypothetical protein